MTARSRAVMLIAAFALVVAGAGDGRANGAQPPILRLEHGGHSARIAAAAADSAGRVLVTASRDEGFGIPLVEAMSLGTPVVVSDIPVFREVAGAAGAYVDPEDVGGFVRAIRELDDEDRWTARSTAARDRAAHYTWEASARILLALLERTTRE